MSGVWGAKVWGGSTSSADRARLPKGTEPCHICGEDAMVEVKLQPCQHEICLGCCNAMRANVVFKADAGLKCPFCRDYVDGFTDMQGCAAARSPAPPRPRRLVSVWGGAPAGAGGAAGMV